MVPYIVLVHVMFVQMFLKGRTEALRTVTAEVKTFLETFTDPNAAQVGHSRALFPCALFPCGKFPQA